MEGNLEIDHACCVDEAFKKLATGIYDIVVSDYEMPQKDGLQFLKELREQNNEIPFILFTGKGREELAIKALNLGADGYINKQGSTETVYGELSHDIRSATEKAKAKLAIEKSERRYRELYEKSPLGYQSLDAEGHFIDVNQAWLDLLGYSREEVIGRWFGDFLVPTQVELFRERFPYFKSAGRIHSEFEIKRKDGSIALIGFDGIIGHDLAGNFKQTHCVLQDITERKKAEEALIESEANYRNLINGMNETAWVIDFDGNFVEVNAAAVKALGYSKEELLSIGIKGIDKHLSPEQIKKLVSTMVTIRNRVFETVHTAKDGKEIPVEISSSLITYQGKQAILSIARNISERKKAEEALRQERDMLESVTAASGAGLVIISKDYHVLWANDFIKRYKGDTIGKLCYATLNSLDAPCLDCGVAKIYAGTTTLDSHEYFSTTVDGNPYWVEIVATPLTDENGNITSAVEICVDVTERKKNEEKLRESIYKNELMNEKLHVVGGLTRHDARNKLMVIRSNVYLLKKQIGDNPKLAKYLEDIDSAINQSDKIFEFSRSYETIGVEKPSKTDVAQCFNQAFALLPNLGTIKIINDCQGLEVMADSLLKQLFYNLIDNSLKHGEKVTQIRLRYKKDEDEVKLFYEDNGVGIPDANKSKLFAEGFTTGKSTGLGLFMIKKMVEVYGWTITEEGEPGTGAKFTITIPKLSKNGKENYQLYK